MATKMLNSINNVEDILGYTFIDSTYLWEALQAPGSGVSVVGTRRIYDGNKRLALRGDSAIRIIIVKDWFSTDCSRGENPLTHEIAQRLTSDPQPSLIASSRAKSQITTYSAYASCMAWRGIST